MIDNIYIDFANLYHNICKDIYRNDIRVVTSQYNSVIDTLGMFRSKKSVDKAFKGISDHIKEDILENYNQDQLIVKYHEISHIWKLDIPFSEWIVYIKQYIEFIRYAEKCFMFRNESSIDREKADYALYCEQKENTIYIRDFVLDTKICINYSESLVNDITIDPSDEGNSILDYVNSGKTKKNQINVEFVYITLAREFGKQLVNEMRFIISENPKFLSDDDKIMIESIQSIVGECIRLNFKDICDNYIRKLARADKNLLVEEVVNGEVLFGH